MRFVVYLVAVLAAAGIVYFVSSTGEPQVADSAAPVEGAEATAQDGQAEIQLVSLKVPDMHCPVACYPAVKKTLEGQTGVSGVDLAKQSEEGIIDNPVVVIKTAPGFDLDQAIAALDAAGFSKSTVTE
ncbi:hypothetical protein SH139x_003822 [Planctomycetaceae bacterium SH139]